MTARIFDIKRFAVHDGPGIRTTLFFKGCPLACIWCHNPESISHGCELSYLEEKCVNCGKCASVCENGVHIFNTGHAVLRENCLKCSKCVKACPTGALTLYGRDITLDEAIEELLEDRDFYGDAGGVTLSGGECLMQADFCERLLAEIKKEGVNTAVDTSGFATKEAIDKVFPYTDLFLYDLKAASPAIHEKCTGKPNEKIIENLRYIDALGGKIEIRIPLVPEYNLKEIEDMAKLLSTIKHLTGVRVLPYHNYAASKYKSLGKKNTLPQKLPTDAEIKKAHDVLAFFGLKLLN